MILDNPDTIYALGFKEALSVGGLVVVAMLAGFGGMLQWFVKAKLTDLAASIKELQDGQDETNARLRDDVTAMKTEAFEFKLYAEREFAKKASLERVHERLNDVLNAVNSK